MKIDSHALLRSQLLPPGSPLDALTRAGGNSPNHNLEMHLHCIDPTRDIALMNKVSTGEFVFHDGQWLVQVGLWRKSFDTCAYVYYTAA